MLQSRPIGNTAYGGVSEMFSSYEEDFHQCESDIRKFLATAGTASSSSSGRQAQIDERINAVFEAEGRMGQAERHILHMEQEVKTLPPHAQVTQSVNQRVRQYRSLLLGFKREWTEVRAAVDRDALLAERRGGRDAELVKNSRLRETGSRIAQGTAQLKDAHRMAVSTEQTGVQIMGDLRGQRELIQQSRAHIDSIDRNLSNSRRVLLQMSRRVLANKIILMGTALVLSLTLILLLFIKLKK
ncbi:unnamed protein product [Amoebophrya sp. A25]|nr:unnamed protein product [Amoebophrya sp. A25]|eukprot:GSA25T00005993001.1